MIYHGHEIKDSLTLKADAVVIGTGAGGATMGAHLAEAGMKVVMLEKGGWYTAKDFSQREEDMAAKIEGERALLASQDGSMAFTFATCVGGSTVHYWADHFRTPGDRMKLWETEHGVEGMSEETLLPHHLELERMLNVHVADERHTNRNNWLIKAGTEAMGYHGEFVTQARKDCIGCGFCMMGCSYNRKQSMLITYVPRALKAGADIYSDARVDRILTKGGRAVGVEGAIVDRETKKPRVPLRIEAPIVVLAAGAIASPIIWLRSRLPDASGWAGCNLVVNPGMAVYGKFAEPVNFHTNIPTAYAVKGFRNATYDGSRYVEGGYLILSNQLHPGYAAALSPAFGETVHSFMRDFNYYASTYSVIDETHTGQITLDGDEPVYDYRVRDVDLLKSRDFLVKSARILLAAGAERIIIPDNQGTVLRDEKEINRFEKEYEVRPNGIIMAGPHLLGTLRMGGSPKTSVVNSQCEAWGTKGLYVADGSVFPTSISVDPSASIMARSLLTAGGILKS